MSQFWEPVWLKSRLSAVVWGEGEGKERNQPRTRLSTLSSTAICSRDEHTVQARASQAHHKTFIKIPVCVSSLALNCVLHVHRNQTFSYLKRLLSESETEDHRRFRLGDNKEPEPAPKGTTVLPCCFSTVFI